MPSSSPSVQPAVFHRLRGDGLRATDGADRGPDLDSGARHPAPRDATCRVRPMSSWRVGRRTKTRWLSSLVPWTVPGMSLSGIRPVPRHSCRSRQPLPDVTWLSASKITSTLRIRKDPDEVEMLRSAASALDRALHRIPAEVRFTGRTESEIARDLQSMTVEEGHDVACSPLSVADPTASPLDHEPGKRVVEPGDLVVCDFGGRHHHYTSDVTRTFAVGTPSPEQEAVHRVVLEASEAARGSGQALGALPGNRPISPTCRGGGRLRRLVHPSHRSRDRPRGP